MKFDLTIEASNIINDVSTIDNIGQFSIAIGNLIKGDSGKSPYIDDTTKTWWEYNDTTKEYEDTGIVAKSVDVYNITNEIPLGAESFYTLSTAITATPVANRKKGLLLMFESAAGIIEAYQFKSIVANWTNQSYWENISPSLKIDKTAIKQALGDSETDVMSQKAVTDEILYTDINSKLSGIKITKGNNLLNRNYIEPLNPFEYEKGGGDKLINATTGIVTDSIYWYLSPLIEWNEQTQVIIFKCRCWAQYGEDGVTLKDIYFPGTEPSGNILINRASGAKFIRVGILKGAGNCMMNYGSTLLPYEPFKEIVQSKTYGETPIYFQADVDEIARFKELLLAESYIPQSPTYTDGVVNSPINVIWADGDTGVLTLTRNTDGLVTKIVATKIRSGVTTTLTENITRDTDGNVTLISIV